MSIASHTWLAVAAGVVSVLNVLPVSAVESSQPQIAASLQKFVDDRVLAGAVLLVSSAEKTLDVESVGFADISAGMPMRPDNLFWIASMTKPMTGTALMMLVDEGKVSIDDAVEKYLPEFKGQMFIAEQDAEHMLLKKPRRPINLRDVLSHTSGMLYKSPIQQPTLDLFPLRTRVQSYAMLPLQFEPGTKYLYSSAGINTAARIIEVVTEGSYEDFLAKRLLEPLGMKDTTFWPSREQLPRIAKSYQPKADGSGLEETPIVQLSYPLDDRTRQPIPGSGLFSTAEDIARFCRMILAGGQWQGRRYLSESSLRQMITAQTAEGLPPYGLGWETTRKPDGVIGHGGSYNTHLRIDREHQRIAVFLVQHTNWRNNEGQKIYSAFLDVAEKAFPHDPAR